MAKFLGHLKAFDMIFLVFFILQSGFFVIIFTNNSRN